MIPCDVVVVAIEESIELSNVKLMYSALPLFILKQAIVLFENNIYDQEASQTFFKLKYYYYIAIGFVHARLVELVSLRKIQNYIEFTSEIK